MCRTKQDLESGKLETFSARSLSWVKGLQAHTRKRRLWTWGSSVYHYPYTYAIPVTMYRTKSRRSPGYEKVSKTNRQFVPFPKLTAKTPRKRPPVSELLCAVLPSPNSKRTKKTNTKKKTLTCTDTTYRSRSRSGTGEFVEVDVARETGRLGETLGLRGQGGHDECRAWIKLCPKGTENRKKEHRVS